MSVFWPCLCQVLLGQFPCLWGYAGYGVVTQGPSPGNIIAKHSGRNQLIYSGGGGRLTSQLIYSKAG